MELPERAAGASDGAQSGTAARRDELQGGLSAGLGLFGAQERVSLVGGRFYLDSALGSGTCVRAVIPLTSHAR
jgi:signal transduction histidine kinase